MAGTDILFETDRFNVSEVKEHFINPCCFGEDLAEWLRHKLIERGMAAGTPGQEDWGWYLFVDGGSERYFLGISGYRKEANPTPNDGEWRIMVQKRRSLWDRLQGRNKMTGAEPILSAIEGILREDRNFRNIRRESP